MSQPPYPPQGGNEPGGEQPGWQGRNPPAGANDPTERFGAPGAGQRDQTRQFGQPPYGQQPGQPPYRQPGLQWAPPGRPGGQRPKGNKNTLIALIIAGVVVLAAIGVALFLLLGNDNQSNAAGWISSASSSSTSSASTSARSSSSSSSRSSSSVPTGGGAIPPATVTPDGLGSDPVLNRYAQSCYGGDMAACDQLYKHSGVGSPYEAYGGTCAGRQPVGNSTTVYFVNAFPGA
ncbi:MAG: uncharacterized protein JWR85_3972 [Marmoricola sp.]|nr:uncharacterized protein [Marmoricola sp.]